MKKDYLFRAVAAGVVLYLLLVAFQPALAQATGATKTVFPLRELLEPVIATLVSAICALLTALLWKGLGRIGIQVNQDYQRTIDEGMRRAITYGANKAVDTVARDRSIDVKSEAIAQAVVYFKERWPDLVKKLGLTDEDIRNFVYARIAPPTEAPQLDAPTAEDKKVL